MPAPVSLILSPIRVWARLACAALMVASVSAGPAFADRDDLSGTYEARSDSASCRILFMEPAARPPESLIVTEATAGLAMAEPGCALAVSQAGLWVHETETGSLTLVGHDGTPLWTGARQDEGWAGVDADGTAIGLFEG